MYQNINTDEKECFTALVGGSAAGDVLPRIVMFKSVPTSWGIGLSRIMAG